MLSLQPGWPAQAHAVVVAVAPMTLDVPPGWSLHAHSMLAACLQPGWSELANDLVVNEKVLVGSRCGPMDIALRMMEQHAPVRSLLRAMTSHVVPLDRAEEAVELAAQKGVLKVQLLCSES